MPRKITQQAVNALYGKYPFKKDNTEVFMNSSGWWCLVLYGTGIATIASEGLKINHHGYLTNTTKERLNGLPGVSITQKKGIWYLNGSEMKEGWNVI